MNKFQEAYCMVSEDRKSRSLLGPYELLDYIRSFIDSLLTPDEQKSLMPIRKEPYQLPLAIAVGYYILSNLVEYMGGKNNGCCY